MEPTLLKASETDAVSKVKAVAVFRQGVPTTSHVSFSLAVQSDWYARSEDLR